jgi:glycogen operon protein
LRPAEFFTGTDHNGNGLKDLTWYLASGAEVDGAYFANPDNHFLAHRIDGTELDDPAASVCVAYNWGINPVVATLAPLNLQAKRWHIVADTSAAAEAWGNIHAAGQEMKLEAQQYAVDGRSVVLFIEK